MILSKTVDCCNFLGFALSQAMLHICSNIALLLNISHTFSLFQHPMQHTNSYPSSFSSFPVLPQHELRRTLDSPPKSFESFTCPHAYACFLPSSSWSHNTVLIPPFCRNTFQKHARLDFRSLHLQQLNQCPDSDERAPLRYAPGLDFRQSPRTTSKS